MIDQNLSQPVIKPWKETISIDRYDMTFKGIVLSLKKMAAVCNSTRSSSGGEAPLTPGRSQMFEKLPKRDLSGNKNSVKKSG